MGFSPTRRGFLSLLAAAPVVAAAEVNPVVSELVGPAVQDQVEAVATRSDFMDVVQDVYKDKDSLDSNRDFTIEAWIVPVVGTVLHSKLSKGSNSSQHTIASVPQTGDVWRHIAVVSRKGADDDPVETYVDGMRADDVSYEVMEIMEQQMRNIMRRSDPSSDKHRELTNMVESLRLTTKVRYPATL